MAPQCNIDARGKAVRLIWGVALLVAAAVVVGLRSMHVIGGWGWWLGAIVLAAGGAFSVYEARHGWCVVRAMGFKTPI